eukprot:TRINITY_DN24976_c0_g1_i1.p1 TRINITY_DN24976_c0_g1~~TRINITY_DN24976_c0_g1_i1.p1  ORF type:complete len:171 (+),score=44.30 TRINITY_DN24976_c0_g1_i1:129-641(+)
MQRGLVGSEMCIRDRYNTIEQNNNKQNQCRLGEKIMNYDDLISKAIQNDEIENLLRGKKPYEIEVSRFTSDVFPTDINLILVNCFYKQYEKVEKINELFEDSLQQMLKGNACNVYIATCLLYTSDAADDTPCVDLGGRRIIKKKKKAKRKYDPGETSQKQEKHTTEYEER